MIAGAGGLLLMAALRRSGSTVLQSSRRNLIRPPGSRVEPEFLKFIVMKGHVTVDGVSLTVMDRDDESFSVSLVQYTQEHTNLVRREPGDQINLETDILARYVDQLLEARAATA